MQHMKKYFKKEIYICVDVHASKRENPIISFFIRFKIKFQKLIIDNIYFFSRMKFQELEVEH